MSVAHDYIPVACGCSVNVNLALLLAQLEDLVLVTDDPIAMRLLALKYQRARQVAPDNLPNPTSLLVQRSPEFNSL